MFTPRRHRRRPRLLTPRGTHSGPELPPGTRRARGGRAGREPGTRDYARSAARCSAAEVAAGCPAAVRAALRLLHNRRRDRRHRRGRGPGGGVGGDRAHRCQPQVGRRPGRCHRGVGGMPPVGAAAAGPAEGAAARRAGQPRALRAQAGAVPRPPGGDGRRPRAAGRARLNRPDQHAAAGRGARGWLGDGWSRPARMAYRCVPAVCMRLCCRERLPTVAFRLRWLQAGHT